MTDDATVRRRLPIAVLISGTGRTLKNINERVAAGRLDVDVRLVIASTPKATGVQFAADAGAPSHVLVRKDFDSDPAYSEAIFAACRKAGAELVVLAGWLKLLVVPDDYRNRVVNIHPALVPSFCGKGYFGHHVHQAAIDYGVKLSGCTVHFVDNQYDHGPVILQKAVPVVHNDTADVLAARVFEAECEALPEALQLIAEGRVTVAGRIVHVS
ncbi:MAG: phosphoribosylglycinamide formyltransferase [Planctomycetaceae bacterium]|nr:phosphoribosylglycinamide formyltransferase [Planctomycetaceae bacterium]